MASKRLPFVDGKIVRIPLTQGKEAIVDLEDLPKVVGRSWQVQKGRSTLYASSYAWDGGKVKCTLLHRLILGAQKEEVVDHCNHDGLDNRRQNLRLATSSLNNCNARRRRDNTSGFKGVSYHKQSKRWTAEIRFRGKRWRLGLFETAEGAAQAYDEAAKRIHQEFAYLNKVSIESDPVVIIVTPGEKVRLSGIYRQYTWSDHRATLVDGEPAPPTEWSGAFWVLEEQANP